MMVGGVASSTHLVSADPHSARSPRGVMRVLHTRRARVVRVEVEHVARSPMRSASCHSAIRIGECPPPTERHLGSRLLCVSSLITAPVACPRASSRAPTAMRSPALARRGRRRLHRRPRWRGRPLRKGMRVRERHCPSPCMSITAPLEVEHGRCVLQRLGASLALTPTVFSHTIFREHGGGRDDTPPYRGQSSALSTRYCLCKAAPLAPSQAGHREGLAGYTRSSPGRR